MNFMIASLGWNKETMEENITFFAREKEDAYSLAWSLNMKVFREWG